MFVCRRQQKYILKKVDNQTDVVTTGIHYVDYLYLKVSSMFKEERKS